MYKTLSKYTWLYILILTVLATTFLTVIIRGELRHELTVAFLDVGQGDAVFIESPSGVQVLVDGGKDGAVLRELAKVMPFYDRSIDMVIATHPDADHIGGLIPILERYSVEYLLHPGVVHDTPAANALFNIERHRMSFYPEEVLARRGQVINLGEGAYIRILFPDRDVTDVETNTASIIAKLVYGDTSFMLTGDAPKRAEEYLVALDAHALDSTVLKLGHHGSKTSSSDMFFGFVNPQYAIISVGADNRYGHPHQEILNKLEQFKIPALLTSEHGTIIFTSDGTNLLLN